MKYFNLKQGKTSNIDNKWHEPKSMNDPDGFEYNTKHGLCKEITEEQAKYCSWGSGNYRQNEDGTFVCICANWDSSG